jgi:YesN/AraC family two-component response regulator
MSSFSSRKKKGITMLKLFIADDSEAILESLHDLLVEIRGIEIVGHAQNAPQAIERIKKLNPDVALLDIRMPGGTGIQVLETIKAYKNTILVIMLTAYPYLQYRQKCEEMGAEYFFDKSTEIHRVQEVLTELAISAQKDLERMSQLEVDEKCS